MEKTKLIMLLITYKCNLHCSYCYEPKVSGVKMSVSKAKQIIKDQLALIGDDYSSVEIDFMGGEPLLEFSLIKEVSEWLWYSFEYEKPLKLFACTNGTLLTDEMKVWFAKNKEKITLGLSFDGDMGMQNENRSMSYSKVDLSFFSTTWPEQSLKMTISPNTIHKMSSGIVYLHEKGFKSISPSLAMGPDIEWGKELLLVYQSELKKLLQYYLDHPFITPCSLFCLDILSLIHHSEYTGKKCSCGEHFICVDWDGNTYACHMFSPIALPIEKALKSNLLYDFSNHAQFQSEICSKCILDSICSHCYGMNYYCSNDVTKHSPFHCSAFKIQFVANCNFRIQLAEKNGDQNMIDIINNILKIIKL